MYQTKVNEDLPSTVTMDKSNFSQHSSSSSLLNSLFEDVPEDDETPSRPVKDELDRYLRTRRDPSAPLMHHFHGGRCVIILGFEIFAKFWFTLESWIRNIPLYCVHGPRLSCNSCYVHLRGATLLHLSSSMH